MKKRIWLLAVVLLLLLSPTALAADRWVHVTSDIGKGLRFDYYYDLETLKSIPIREGEYRDYLIECWVSVMYRRLDGKPLPFNEPVFSQERILYLHNAKKFFILRATAYRADHTVIYDYKFDFNDWRTVKPSTVDAVVLEAVYLASLTKM